MGDIEHDRKPSDGVEPLVEEFLARSRRGEALDVRQFAGAHPAHERELLELLPALLALEASPARELTPSHAAVRALANGARFGEFRIVREIGRGGMGLVYEAVQEPLGRRVALKLLPSHRLHRESD